MDMYRGPILEREDERWEERLKGIGAPLLAWYKTHARDLPWRQDEDPYRIWISEIMLQQTRVEAVKPYYRRFMEKLPNVAALAQVEEETLLKLWEGLGYYSRAKNLQKAAIQIVERYEGRVPATYEQLIGLPGIGSYTAGAIASIAYKIPVPAVDGNVLRVISRVLGSFADIGRPQTKTWIEGALKKTMDQKQPGLFNQGLFEVGALLCTPVKGVQKKKTQDTEGMLGCDACPLAFVCAAREKGLWRQIPVKSGKKARRIEEKTVLVMIGWEEQAESGLGGTGRTVGPGAAEETGGLGGAGGTVGSGAAEETGGQKRREVVALQKRPPQGLLASLYEFPNMEGKLSLDAGDGESLALIARITGVAEERIGKISPLGEAKHVFSHVEWHMVGYQIQVEGSLPQSFICADIRELEGRYPLPSAFLAYRKALFKVK